MAGIRLRIAGAPRAEIRIAGVPAFTFPLEPVRSYKCWYTKDGDTVPEVAVGDDVEIRIGGEAVWDGAFEKD